MAARRVKKTNPVAEPKFPPRPKFADYEDTKTHAEAIISWEVECDRIQESYIQSLDGVSQARERDPKLRADLERAGVKPPEAPNPALHGAILLTTYQGELMWQRETGDLLCTPVVACGSPTYPDRPGAPRVTRWEVVAHTGRTTVDLSATDIHTRGGSAAIAKLVEAGVNLAPGGSRFMLDYLGFAPAGGPAILDKPGWFRTAAGVLVYVDAFGRQLAGPASVKVELSDALRLDKPASPPGADLATYVAGIAPFFIPFKNEAGETVEPWAHQAALGVAFAGAVVGLCDGRANVPNVFSGLEGDPGVCKTTCLELLASVYGPPGKNQGGMHESQRQTPTAVETPVLRAHCAGLALDEIMSGKVTSDQAYAIEDGAIKGRGKRVGGRQERSTFRLAVMVSGERSLAEMLKSEGEVQKEGLNRRYLPLPVDDQTPKLAEEPWALAEAAMRQHYGTAAPAYVAHLASRYGADPESLARRVADCGRAIVRSGLREREKPAPVMARAGAMVAAIVVGLEVAQEAGLVPAGWKSERLAETLWGFWLGASKAVTDPAQAMLDNIADALVRGRGSIWMELEDWQAHGSYREMAAWRTRYRGEAVYVIRSSALLDMAATNATAVKARRLLYAKGVLLKRNAEDSQLTHDDFAGLGRMKGGFIVLKASAFDCAEAAVPGGRAATPQAANDATDSALRAAS